ncbi:hypothetical protein NONO_c60530 [Nocardia nova SH22a]|uniref:Uncharacterized protein n=2 Tax=Nocardia nova TaxID=37330 RepID=W5TNU1_9NOCA|nr:hypothetical protein NONO_c60530 [Nocardia nova SH22a]
MLGTVLSALWTIISAGDFAIPRWAFHELGELAAYTGSA